MLKAAEAYSEGQIISKLPEFHLSLCIADKVQEAFSWN